MQDLRIIVLQSVSGRLHEISRTWVALTAVAVFVLFTAVVLPAQSARSAAYTGDALSPDSSLFYTPEELYRAARSYGEEGRAAYVRSRFTFDVIWPLVYLAFLGTSISWVYERAFPLSARWQAANVLPVLGALFDLFENVSTSIVMLRYPAHSYGAASVAPAFTLVKWILIACSFGSLLVGTVILLGRSAGASP